MIDALFRDAATAEGWTEATQVILLLRYVAQHGAQDAFWAFLEREAGETGDRIAPILDPADRFMRDVIVVLRDPGLALQPAFRSYCANSHDLLTPRQAAERWCCWQAC